MFGASSELASVTEFGFYIITHPLYSVLCLLVEMVTVPLILRVVCVCVSVYTVVIRHIDRHTYKNRSKQAITVQCMKIGAKRHSE